MGSGAPKAAGSDGGGRQRRRRFGGGGASAIRRRETDETNFGWDDMWMGRILVGPAVWVAVSLTVAIGGEPGRPGGEPVPAVGGQDAAAGGRRVDFSLQVMPLLAEHCLLCHGPDEQAGGLRLDRPDDLAQVVVAGDVDGSELIDRLITSDPDLRMPADRPPLGDAEIAIIRRWVQEGADWPHGAGHWAFAPLRRPVVPDTEFVPDTASGSGERVSPESEIVSPAETASWPRGAIDRFVLAGLRARERIPNGPADRATLIRRLSLDLLGLPPEPDEIERFLKDRSPGAYERLVDRLLASPHYGERWAQRWLDLARYGDTDGYDFDRVRPAWPYREWVIAAFNRDLPFDRFVTEQLAGDLLPDATDDQRIATGFIRNSPVPQYRFDAMVDRVATTGTVFLGLSLECAQCHNHKFDPVTQEEFYQLMAVFNQAADQTETVRSPLSGLETEALVVARRDRPVPTYVALGGSFLDPGPEVAPGTLSDFHRPAPTEAFDRLDLARWLTDTENPLTARVAANRQWEVFFGRGLVATSEDLGTRTDRPSHPELLDWLAVEFQESGWSTKHLHRLIVTSATYRQSSARTAEQQRADPENLWLGRGPRFRVDAETIRDIALSAASALDRRIGGPSVYPHQPSGISENRTRGAMKWTPSHGGDRYRRGLYTFWKRAALYPSFAIFDAPRREDACARRGRSNSPLQALVTLNDPAFVEAAVMLGRRMWAADPRGTDPGKWVDTGFRLCTGRNPTEQERQRLLAFLDTQRGRFAADPEAARALLANAEAAVGDAGVLDQADRAACVTVANALLSLDETISRP